MRTCYKTIYIASLEFDGFCVFLEGCTYIMADRRSGNTARLVGLVSSDLVEWCWTLLCMCLRYRRLRYPAGDEIAMITITSPPVNEMT